MRDNKELFKLLELICNCYQGYIDIGLKKEEALKRTISNYDDIQDWLYGPTQDQKNSKNKTKNQGCFRSVVSSSTDTNSRKNKRIENLKKRLGECMRGLSKRKKQQAKDHLFKDTLKKFDDDLYWQVVDKIEKISSSNK